MGPKSTALSCMYTTSQRSPPLRVRAAQRSTTVCCHCCSHLLPQCQKSPLKGTNLTAAMAAFIFKQNRFSFFSLSMGKLHKEDMRIRNCLHLSILSNYKLPFPVLAQHNLYQFPSLDLPKTTLPISLHQGAQPVTGRHLRFLFSTLIYP